MVITGNRERPRYRIMDAERIKLLRLLRHFCTDLQRLQ